MTNISNRAGSFERDGFVVVRGFLNHTDLEDLQRELDRFIGEVVPGLPDTCAFYHDRSRPETLKQLQHMGRDPFFDEYRRNTRWKELAESLVGEPAQGQEPEWFNKPPGVAHATPPHQDNFYFCLRPAKAVTLWLALDTVDCENGCLRYVARSHRGGVRAHSATQTLGFSQAIRDYSADDRRNEQRVDLQPGDLVAHHCETIHRAEANRSSSRQRRAFAVVFRGQSCQRDRQAYARYLAALNHQHQTLGLQ